MRVIGESPSPLDSSASHAHRSHLRLTAQDSVKKVKGSSRKLRVLGIIIVFLVGLVAGGILFHYVFPPSVPALVSVSKWDSTFDISSFDVSGFTNKVANVTDGLEWNITCDKSLKTWMSSNNNVSVSINSSNLEFYYQAPLDHELNVSQFDFVNATVAIRNGNIVVYRPENLIGGYVGYGPHQGNKYGTGKVVTIYRPLLVDGLGQTSWGWLNISGAVLTVGWNKTWVASCSFPVVIDPSFGYTTAGGTLEAEGAYNDYVLAGSYYSISDGATSVSNLTVYIKANRTGCIAYGMNVDMFDGSYKQIQDVRLGDVLSSTIDGRQIVPSAVEKIWVLREPCLELNGKLNVSYTQPIFVNGEWKQAGEIQKGDYMLLVTGELYPVTAIRDVGELTVYDINVAPWHVYFVQDILVHNKPGYFWGAIYKYSDSSKLNVSSDAYLTQEGSGATEGPEWITVNFTAGTALTASTNYWLIVRSQAVYTTEQNFMYYDTVTSAGGRQDIGNNATWPNPCSLTGNNYRYSVYANYTSAGGGTTDYPPTYTTIGSNETIAGNPVNCYVLWVQNSSAPSYFIFGTNNTGPWVNQTAAAVSSNWGNYSFTLNTTVGIHIGWEEWCNDTGGSWNNTGIQVITTTLYQSITVNTSTHSWSINPGTNNVTITENSGKVSLTVTSNAAFDIGLKASAALTYADNTIALSNTNMSASTWSAAIALSTSYQTVPGLSNIGSGTGLSENVFLWLSCPTNIPAGAYTWTLTFEIIQHGGSY